MTSRRVSPLLLLVLMIPFVRVPPSYAAPNAPLEPATEPIPLQTNMTLGIMSYMGHWCAPGYLSWGARDRNLDLSTLSPLLGATCSTYRSSDPALNDWVIKWAVEHGISVFFLNYAIDNNGTDPTYDAGFLRSKYLDRVKFAFTIFPAHWFDDRTEMMFDLRVDLEKWSATYFSHPSYLRMGSRPVLMIPDIGGSLDRWGPSTFDEFLEMLRDTTRSHGYDPFLIGDVFYGGPLLGHWAEKFDAIYESDFDPRNFQWQRAPNGCQTAPYKSFMRDLLGQMRDYASFARSMGKPFIPVTLPGINNENLYVKEYDDWCFKVIDPSPELLKTTLKSAGVYADKELKLILINSWNEFNERHSIEPTEEYGFSYVDAVREAFASGDAQDWPPDIAPTLGNGYIQYFPDGSTSSDIPVNSAWQFLNQVSRNLANTPIFNNPEAQDLASLANDKLNEAFSTFLENDFEDSVRLAEDAVQIMMAAYDTEGTQISTAASGFQTIQTTNESTSASGITGTVLVPLSVAVLAMAVVLTTIVLRRRRF